MKNTCFSRLLGLLCSLAIGYHGFAQQDVYRFEAIDNHNGLSNNQVNAITKDENGFLWFGTLAGLNRYDGYTFKIFKHIPGDSTSLNDDYVMQLVQGPEHSLWVNTPNGWNILDPRTEKVSSRLPQFFRNSINNTSSITTIVRDKKNNFWFVCAGIGLGKYNTASKSFVLYTPKTKPTSLYAATITWVAEDAKGFIWIVYTDGYLEKMDASGNIVFRSEALKSIVKQKLAYRLFIDGDDDLWVYAKGLLSGIYYYKPQQNFVKAISKETKNCQLNNNLVNGVTQDNKGMIWVATDHGGLNLIDKKNFSVRYLTNNEMDAASISENSIMSVYKDNLGIIWSGTFKKGINKFQESNLKFPLFHHLPGKANSLAYNDINKFAEDRQGNLWIGTNGGGLIYFNRALGTFKQYLHDPTNENSLTNNVIVSIYMDHEDKLWIGTFYGGMDCYDGRTFRHYKHDPKNPASLADDKVWEIFEDSQQRLWVGTLSEGVDLLDRKTGTFIHHKPGPGNAIHTRYVCAFAEDKVGNIWMGTDAGVSVLDKATGLFRRLVHIDGNKNTISHNTVVDIIKDSRNLIWLATRNGLNVYDPQKNTFKSYNTQDGLPDNSIRTIVEDNNHNLWVTTTNSVTNILVSRMSNNDLALQFKNYDRSDGLQRGQFNENATLKTKSGEIVVGGADGFNLFFPSNISESLTVPKLSLTDLQVFNNSIKIGEKYDGEVLLPQSIIGAKEITLGYNQNVFTIEFAALGFLNADKIQYAYKLEGFNKDWLKTDAKNRKATFTNLNPGDYTLVIKASNSDGAWSQDYLSLAIHIQPPFWLAPYAYAFYALLVIGMLVLGRYIILKRAKTRFALERERQRAQRLHELDMMKIKFFTNVSHEFRTPLSLIISPVEKLLKEMRTAEDKKHFQLIYRNARRLLNLVNQLLDFRKLEEQELKLNKTSGDIIKFINEAACSFSDIAENKKINFGVSSSEEMLFTTFDHDKLERIIFNLLSNAFKFTHSGGSVQVKVETSISGNDRLLHINVLDTGIGISSEKHEKIFERFFQNDIPDKMVNQGSGIGLAITREFVRLHNGSITLQSEKNRGSCFTVTLPIVPIQMENEEPDNLVKEPLDTPLVLQTQVSVQKVPGGKAKTILLVEDNDDFRFYIKDNLKAHYTILEAPNGKIGWQKALADHPDLIVCDISMPEMNGIDLCKKIKQDGRTSFIPVVLLTALTGEQQQIAGLQTGANDYMTKPFNFEILLSKINNLLLQQENLKRTYQKQLQVKPADVVSVSADEKFLQQLLLVVEKNISNPEFSVESLSREMCMSRVALYKKIFSLAGKTPIEFIRVLRLQRAAQLLQKNEMSVAEVAYEVGFNNPKNFSKYFKAEYNVLPSSYINRNNAEEELKRSE